MDRARRSITRKFALSLFWLNFVFLWYRVFQFTGAPEALHSATYLSSMIAFYAAIAAIWIYHNVQLWKKKGPRLSVREVVTDLAHDSMLHDVSWTIDVEQEQSIRINVLGNSKVFLRGSTRARPHRLPE